MTFIAKTCHTPRGIYTKSYAEFIICIGLFSYYLFVLTEEQALWDVNMI